VRRFGGRPPVGRATCACAACSSQSQRQERGAGICWQGVRLCLPAMHLWACSLWGCTFRNFLPPHVETSG
jgi:hypothetical protein